jgi:hypothetical protein
MWSQYSLPGMRIAKNKERGVCMNLCCRCIITLTHAMSGALPAARTVIVVYKLLTHRPASVVHLQPAAASRCLDVTPAMASNSGM